MIFINHKIKGLSSHIQQAYKSNIANNINWPPENANYSNKCQDMIGLVPFSYIHILNVICNQV